MHSPDGATLLGVAAVISSLTNFVRMLRIRIDRPVVRSEQTLATRLPRRRTRRH